MRHHRYAQLRLTEIHFGFKSANNNVVHADPALLRSLLRLGRSRSPSVGLVSPRLLGLVGVFLKEVLESSLRLVPSNPAKFPLP